MVVVVYGVLASSRQLTVNLHQRFPSGTDTGAAGAFDVNVKRQDCFSLLVVSRRERTLG